MWKSILLTLILSLCFNIISIAQEIIENPVFDRSDVPEFHVEKVVITQDTTYIYCFYEAEADSWARISKDMYLEDANSGARFPLLKASGLPYAPLKREFIFNETIQVLLCFPHINTDKFNVVEEEGERAFNIYGIDISKCYKTKYKASDYWRFNEMSDFYKSANNDEKFLEFEEKELGAAQYLFGLRTLPASECYEQLSDKYDELGDYSKSIKLRLLRLECDSIFYGVENREHVGYPMNLYFLSMTYQNAGNDTKALQCMQKCINIWRKIESPNLYLNTVLLLIMSGHGEANIGKRIEIAQKELDNLPFFVNDTTTLISKIQIEIARGYSQLGDIENTLIFCNKALATLRSSGNEASVEYAEVLAFKCKCQRIYGNYDDAIIIGEKAKLLFESLSRNSMGYADLLVDLAKAYLWNFDYEKSVHYLKTAAGIYNEAKEWILLAEVYNDISFIYQRSEDTENAKHYITNAIALLNAQDGINCDYFEENNLTESPHHNDSVSINNKKIYYDKWHFLETLARIYEKEGNIKDAIKTEIEAGVIIKNFETEKEYASHLYALSEYYLKDKQYENAINCAEQSANIYSNDDNENIALTKGIMARIYENMGDYEKAIQYDRETIELLKSDAQLNLFLKMTIQSCIARNYWQNHDLIQAEKCLSELLDNIKDIICEKIVDMSAEQKQRYWDRFSYSFFLYRNIVAESDRNDIMLSKLYDYVLFSKIFLLETEINERHLQGQLRINASWKDIQAVLSEDEIAIEFISTTQEGYEGYIYSALIIDKNSKSPQLLTLLNDLDIEDTPQLLGEKIWDPIFNMYNHVRNIYFSPDLVLHAYPIEYLRDSENRILEKFNMYRLSSTKELLKNRKNNIQGKAVLYGGLEYNQMADFALEEKTGTLPSLLRGISERGGFEPLYNTLDEVNNIRDLLSSQNIATTLYVGNEGTEESFRKLSGMNIHILHLATHGMYIEPENVSLEKHRQNFDFLESLNNENNPVKEDVTLTHSFLVLSGGNKLIQHSKVSGDDDGILTAKEISETDLKGVDLVVLSACESAFGDINHDGIYGLQRGFKKAGVNTILMSLGKVDDEATRILMVEFYRNLMSGKTKLQSLKDAQQYLREYENGKYDDPKYWASFIMLDGLN